MEGYFCHRPATPAAASAAGNREIASSHADGDPVLPRAPRHSGDMASGLSPNPSPIPIPVAKRPPASSPAWPDIGSSFEKFAAKLLPEFVPQAALDVVCQIGRDGLLIFDSPSATQMLGMYPLQNIARCDVVDSSVFELWTNNSSGAQPTRIRLQSDGAGDLLDAVTAAAMEHLGFTNWMYLIKHGSEENDCMGKTLVSLRHGDGPRVQNDRGLKNVVARNRIPMKRMPQFILYPLSRHDITIMATLCAPVIPPYNSAATHPKDVYPLGKLVRAGEWRYLRDIIELMERGDEVKFGPDAPYPPYVGFRLKKLWGTKDEAGRAKLGCLLSLINYIIKFNSGHYSRVAAADIPPALFRKFSDLFIVPDTGRINNFLVRSYVIVLCLIVDDFRTPCGSLPFTELGITNWVAFKELIFELVGCKISTSEAFSYAELCTPLELPKEKFGGYFRKREREEREERERRKWRKCYIPIEQVRKRMRDLVLNETTQPPGHDGVM